MIIIIIIITVIIITTIIIVIIFAGNFDKSFGIFATLFCYHGNFAT